MIVKMKKITLLLSAKARKSALSKLRELGVLQIQHVQPPQSEDLDRIHTELNQVETALRIVGSEGKDEKRIPPDEVPGYVQRILELSEKKSRRTQALDGLRETFRWYESWGSVSRASVQNLKEAGIWVRFYLTDKSGLKKIPAETPIHVARVERGAVRLAFFAMSEEDRLDSKEDQMPDVDYEELKEEIHDLEVEIRQVDDELAGLSHIRGALLRYEEHLKKQLEISEVLHSMGVEEHFVYLQGFCPEEDTSKIRRAADEEDWATIIEDPDDPNEVPTLIRNPKWLRIVNPLFQFMGTLPGYEEYDISFWFLLFMSVFFGIIIGDAGYGIVMVGLTLYASRKAGKHIPREPFRLMTVFGVATVVWGVISGNWFGFARIAQIPFLNRMVIDRIDSFAEDNSAFMTYLCFIIAVIHLSIAHGIRAFKIINSPRALGEVGWICMLWALFFLAGNLVLGNQLPPFTLLLLLLGFLLALVFTNFQKNIFKGMGATLINLPLNVIGSFSDIVSYIRLFAVSSASVAVATSFNDMALGGGIHTVLGGFIAAIILFFGHSLNIVLGMMSVIVHGVRLNMLEFSNHINMQWAGKAYKPFKE